MRFRKNKPIRVRVSGGLGNQLFMYFAGFALSCHLEVPLETYRKLNDKAKDLHSGDLSEFGISLLSDSKNIENISEKKSAKLQRKLSRNFWFSNRFCLRLLNHFESPDIGFDYRLFDLSPGVNIRGYFQTFKYYDYCLEHVDKDQIIALKNPSSGFKTYMDSFESKRTCAIHVRRGDYLLHQESIGLKGVVYYKRAIKKVLDSRNVDRFAVFSDDSEAAYKLLDSLLPLDTLWPHNFESLSDSENLILMSKADSLVIANSSFSLMAGLLADEKTLVLRPSTWFVGQDEPLDLSRPSWMEVESD
jgi:hypothetical protein